LNDGTYYVVVFVTLSVVEGWTEECHASKIIPDDVSTTLDMTDRAELDMIVYCNNKNAARSRTALSIIDINVYYSTFGALPKTSSIVRLWIVPSFNALILSSICFLSPTMMIAIFSGSIYFFATR
jgi:hypothetical protein